MKVKPTGVPDHLPDRLIDRYEVSHRTGLGRSSIYHKMQRGEFPRPFLPAPGAARWSLREVEAWVAQVPRSTGIDRTAA